MSAESMASDLPETNYKVVLTLEILVVIICNAMFKIKMYLLAFCSNSFKM
jgi:hypothetical protein